VEEHAQNQPGGDDEVEAWAEILRSVLFVSTVLIAGSDFGTASAESASDKIKRVGVFNAGAV
jgi:hypothetical protein